MKDDRGRQADTTGRYTIVMDTDGSGNWRVNLPADCTWEDMVALGPVIDEVRAFVEPTVHAA